jgi:Cu-Zn family superoxide dismutase
MKKVLIAMLAMGGFVAPALGQAQAPQTFEGPVQGAKGDPIGKITIHSGANALLIRVSINAGGLTPGWHGIHFHHVGDCSDPGQFERSKGHVNPTGRQHGLLNLEGPDAGDLPNIHANADGSVNAEVSTTLIRLSGENGLRDADGSALVIHASEDDQSSQPIGNAGARVACAVIK